LPFGEQRKEMVVGDNNDFVDVVDVGGGVDPVRDQRLGSDRKKRFWNFCQPSKPKIL